MSAASPSASASAAAPTPVKLSKRAAAAAAAAAAATVPSSAVTQAQSAAADPDDSADASASLSLLLPPTARSRPVLLHHRVHLSTSASRRVRLTCLDCNARALLVAANTGTIYAYQRPNPALMLQHVNNAAPQPATAGAAAAAVSQAASRVGLLKLISRTKDAITHIRFCPTHDDIVAVATSSNQLMLLDLRLGNLKDKENLLFNLPGLAPLQPAAAAAVAAAAAASGGVPSAAPTTSSSSSSSSDDTPGHRDRISHLVWDASGTRLFSGDRSGVVVCSRPFGAFASPSLYLASLAAASATQAFFAKKPSLKEQAHIIYRAESEVVQMVCVDGGDAMGQVRAAVAASTSSSTASSAYYSSNLFLAISTLTKCVVLPLARPSAGVVTVGTKVRNGPFGVCKSPSADGAPQQQQLQQLQQSSASAASSPSSGTLIATTPAETTLLASRPGKRVWSAQMETGQVLSTLKLKLPSPSTLNPFAQPSFLPLPPNASTQQFYSLLPFQHGLLSFYCGDSATAGGIVGTAPPSAPPASPFLCFIDPHHVLIHELVDMGGPVRQVAMPSQTGIRVEAGCAPEIWVLHEPATKEGVVETPPPAVVAAAAAAAIPPGADDAEGGLQVSVLLAYPADMFLAHVMRLTPGLFPAGALATMVSPGLLAPHPTLPLLPASLSGLFPAAVASNPAFAPTLDFFVRTAIRHHVHDRGLLTLLRQQLTEVQPPATVAAVASPSGEAEGVVPPPSAPVVDEQLLAAFDALIDEAEHMERLRGTDYDEPLSEPSSASGGPIMRQNSAPLPASSANGGASAVSSSGPLNLPTPARATSNGMFAAPSPSPVVPSSPTLVSGNMGVGAPSPSPAPPAVQSSSSNSIESLLTKAFSFRSKDNNSSTQQQQQQQMNSAAEGIPSRRSDSPDPGQFVPSSSSSSSFPQSRSASVSLSSSPQNAPGAFLPPPAGSQPLGGGGGPGARAQRGSGVGNPFISSLPPPQLPTHPQSRQSSLLATNNAPPASTTAPAAATPTSSLRDSLKEFMKDVSNEWNGHPSSNNFNAANAAATATASAGVNVAATSPSSAAFSSSAVPSGASSTAPSSSPSPLTSPSFAKASLLPASGPFGAPVLSPMLAKHSSLVSASSTPPPASSRALGAGRAGGLHSSSSFTSGPLALSADAPELQAEEAELSAQFLSAPPLLDQSAGAGASVGAGGGKRRRKKGPAEVVQIARAPAKLLPTPFQPVEGSAAAAAAALGGEEGGAEGVSNHSAAQQEQDDALAAEEDEAAAAAALSASPLGYAARRIKKEKKKSKKAAAAAVEAAIPVASVSAPPIVAPSALAVSSVPSHAFLGDDGIDPADLVGDDDEEQLGGGEGASEAATVAAAAAAVGVSEVEGSGEGQPSHGRQDDQEGVSSGGPAVDPFGSMRLAAASALIDLSESGAIESLPAQWAKCLPVLQVIEVAHAALDLVRRERFGKIGCEVTSLDSHTTQEPAPMFPAFTNLLDGARAELQAIPSTVKASAEVESLDSFVSSFVSALESSLAVALAEGEPLISSFGVAPHPASVAPGCIAALSKRTQALSAGLAELLQSDPRATFLGHVQQLLLVLLQLRLRDRVVAAHAPLAGEDAAASPSAIVAAAAAVHSSWSTEDLLAFLQVYAPLLHSKQVLAVCNSYELSDIIEQLHRVLNASSTPAAGESEIKSPTSASSAVAAAGSGSGANLALVIEGLLSSSVSESILQAFALLKRQQDGLLSHRFLRGCFQRGNGGSSNLSHNLPLHFALDHSVQLYPQISPWLLVKFLDIKVSLFAAGGAGVADRLCDPTGSLDRRCVDLSAAPEHLQFHSSYLEVLELSKHAKHGPGSMASHLQSSVASAHVIDRVQQQCHCYWHYLRTLLNTHQVVRRNPILVLEYIRLCLCFSKPKHAQLFRRPSKNVSSEADGELMAASAASAASSSWVPARDSQSAGLWVHEAVIMSLLAQPTVYAIDTQRVGRLFAKQGFFRGVLWIYMQQLQQQQTSGETDPEERAGLVRQCFQIALDSDDVSSFTSCMDSLLVSSVTPLDQRVQLWKFILTSLHSLVVSPDAHTIAPRHLSLRFLLNHMLYSIGSQLSVTLLLSSSSFIDLCDRANLPAGFYNDVLDLAVLRCEQACVNQALMESLDAYLWSDRSRNIAQNIRAVHNTEVTVAMEQQQQQQQQQMLQQQQQKSKGGGSRRGSASLLTATPPDRPPQLAAHPLSPFITYRGGVLDVSAGIVSSGATSTLLAPTSSDDRPNTRRRPSGSNIGGSSGIHVQRLTDYEMTFEDANAAASDESSRGGRDGADSTSETSFYEDLSNHSHWGMTIELEGACCAECTLPLVHALDFGSLPAFPPLIAFRCQHVYHQSCCTQKACTACWEEAASNASA